MNHYYSYIDKLNLTLEDLINLSPYKLKSVTDEVIKINPKNRTTIIGGLEDSVLRSYHITVEKNKWLKALLLNDVTTLKKHTVELNLEYVDYIYGFKLFLELYLVPVLKNVIDNLIDTNELKLLHSILNQPEIFSNLCREKAKHVLENRLDYAISFLNDGVKDNPNDHIKYIKNYHFHKITNLFTPDLDDKVVKLYDTITDTKSKFDVNSENPLLKFILQSQVAFNKSQVEDVATKLFIDNNAEEAKKEAFKEPLNSEIDKSEIDGSIKFKIAVGSLTILILLIIGILNLIPKDNKPINDNTKNIKKKKNVYDNRIQFYYSLKLLTNKKAKIDIASKKSTEIKPFQNPYPKTFLRINSDTISSKTHDLLITNNSGLDLIVFKLIKGLDQTIYIPKKTEIYIQLKSADSILFVTGNKFVKSKFSHFNKKMSISEIYMVKKSKATSPSQIIINPSDEETTSITKENIKTSENIELNTLRIDNLYRDYYYRKNN